jgi:hypothetical protein
VQKHGVPRKNFVVIPAYSGIKLSFYFKTSTFVKYGRCVPENKEIDFKTLTNGDICFNAA